MSNKIEMLVHTIKESFNGRNPWFGDSLINKLNKIDYRIVNITLTDSNNSIAMIIQHLINWRVFAIEKMNKNQAFDIKINSTNDWTKINIDSETEWTELLSKLISTQNKIIALLEELMVNNHLNDKVSGKDYSFEHLINGIIQHDIYHLGQIGLLHKQIKNNEIFS